MECHFEKKCIDLKISLIWIQSTKVRLLTYFNQRSYINYDRLRLIPSKKGQYQHYPVAARLE